MNATNVKGLWLVDLKALEMLAMQQHASISTRQHTLRITFGFGVGRKVTLKLKMVREVYASWFPCKRSLATHATKASIYSRENEIFTYENLVGEEAFSCAMDVRRMLNTISNKPF